MACSETHINQGKCPNKPAITLPKPKLTRMIGKAQHRSVDIEAMSPENINKGLIFFICSSIYF